MNKFPNITTTFATLVVASLLGGCFDEQAGLIGEDTQLEELDALELEYDAHDPEPWDDGGEDDDEVLPTLPDLPEGCAFPPSRLPLAPGEGQEGAALEVPAMGVEAPKIAREDDDDEPSIEPDCEPW